MNVTSPITVIGAGAWGTALAILLARNGQAVRLWDHDPHQASALYHTRHNSRYLPDIEFPAKLEIFADLSEALADVQDVLIVVPSHAFREVLKIMQPYLSSQARIVWGTKGLDPASGKLPHEVVIEILGKNTPMALIAGPSIAKEVALNLPTAITLASTDLKFGQSLIERLRNPAFRVYISDDIIGAEICGAVKNVLAIAVGTCDGLMMGANARCALITRGLIEMARLGIAVGGRRETFMGLAGLGDLVLTATDNQARNRRFGIAIGAGKTVAEAQRDIGLVEGISNAIQVYNLSRRVKIEMPICEQVYYVLHKGSQPIEAVKALLSRDLKEEGI